MPLYFHSNIPNQSSLSRKVVLASDVAKPKMWLGFGEFKREKGNNDVGYNNLYSPVLFYSRRRRYLRGQLKDVVR